MKNGLKSKWLVKKRTNWTRFYDIISCRTFNNTIYEKFFDISKKIKTLRINVLERLSMPQLKIGYWISTTFGNKKQKEYIWKALKTGFFVVEPAAFNRTILELK